MFSVPENKQEMNATISAANHLLTERIGKAVEIKRERKKQDKLLQEAVVDVSKLEVPQLVVSFSGCSRKFWARSSASEKG